MLYADFSECQGTSGDRASVDTARKERHGISAARFFAFVFDHLFVAGVFDIAAKQDVRKPQKRLKPINGKEKKSKWLQKVVAPLQMRLLMCEHVGAGLFVEIVGKINARTKNAKDKRRGNLLALINVFPIFRCGAKAKAQTKITEKHIADHQDQPDEPYRGGNEAPDL